MSGQIQNAIHEMKRMQIEIMGIPAMQCPGYGEAQVEVHRYTRERLMEPQGCQMSY